MPLTPGSRVGPYEIVAPIGQGGMGEVYRGRDARLQRDVAIKVLPALFARDPERLARFEREARTLAALNHPHVAQVYGLVDLPAAAGGHGLVLEYVDGDDLAARIEAAGRVPVDEALGIARQIAEALETAHAAGIVHRDLKPANIKVRGDGQVKVLDFGLAKALAPADAVAGVDMENSPTITSPFQLSQLGIVLGTAAYMSPEQARGKPADKRADIWAFGCVLYEMLTARRAFPGGDITETLAAIIRAEPDWTALPPDTPPSIRTLLRRCLHKDPRERLPDIGAARLELIDAMHGVETASPRPPAAPPPRRPIVAWTIAALATAAAFATGAYAVVSRPAADTGVFKSLLMPAAALTAAPALRLQISPDGRQLAYVAADESGRASVWIHSLDALSPRRIAGTTGASAPFWAPDSRRLAFIADGKLKTVDSATGTVVAIADASLSPPGTWSADDVILFSGGRGPLVRVPASGGTPVEVTRLHAELGERIQILPSFLPDNRHFLYTFQGAGQQTRGVYLGSLDSQDTTKLLDSAAHARYASGRLVFLRDTTLLAQPFDPGTLTLSGTAQPIAEQIQVNMATGTGAFSISATGVLVYQSAPSSYGTHVLWFDRAGKVIGALGENAGYHDVQLSPDGQFASLTITPDNTTAPDVWLFDLARGNHERRFTFGGGYGAVWSPDGRRLAYASRRGTSVDLFAKAASGGAAETLLLHDAGEKVPLQFSPDGKYLLYGVPNGAATGIAWLLGLDGGPARPLMSPPSREGFRASNIPAEVSPDSRWVAFVSDETGRREIYVTSFPDAVGRWQISNGGGDQPRWRADGKELFFVANDKLMAADVLAANGQFDIGAPRRLFDVRVPAAALGTRSSVAATRDGQRFLINSWDPRVERTPITLVVNWPAAIR